jgi:membrane associated rhomboid family serine protease
MNNDRNAPPLNPLPPIVWILALPVIAIELVLNLADRGLIGGQQGIGWRQQALERFAFSPELLHRMIEAGQYPLNGLHRLISYPLVHGNFTHAIFAIVILLALGKMVGEIFRWWAVLAVVMTSAAAGALAYWLLLPAETPLLFGGYPAVYGLIGAFTYLLWTNLARVGANKYRAFSMIGFLLLVQLVFGVLFGGGSEWVADLAGFASGFALSFVVSPGGWRRLLGKMRQR